MTVKRRREIAQIAALAYARILELDEIPENNEEYDYFLSVLMAKISIDLQNFLGEDLVEK